MADYLMHFNPNHDPKTGRFDFSKEGYKSLKQEYKQDIKLARKEFKKVIKESGKNKIFKSKVEALKAEDFVDRYATRKSIELYNKYIDLKKYKTLLNGKEFKENRLTSKEYFTIFGLYPQITSYIVYKGLEGNPSVRKSSRSYYYFVI